MVTGKDFISKVEKYFNFLESEFGFKILKEKNKENLFYDVQFRDNKKIVSISYENTEDYLQVIVFILEDGELPDYDNKTHTLHLDELNSIVFPQINKYEIESNDKLFSNFEYKNNIDKQLLKKAKELRLCLKHFDIIGNTFD